MIPWIYELTQTELGRLFGLSSISIGKKLIELNLTNKKTKLATKYAISRDFAGNVMYLQDGKEVTISMWDYKAVRYIKEKTSQDEIFIAEMLIGRFKKLKKIEEDSEENFLKQSKFIPAYVDFEILFNKFKDEHHILALFYFHLEKNKLITYAKNYALLEEVEAIARKTKLENNLKINENKEILIKI